MSRVTCDISASTDGHVTGPGDLREKPFGDGGETLHDWLDDAATDADAGWGDGGQLRDAVGHDR